MTDQATLNRESDARFWAIAGYQPGHKLDPHNAIDALMIPVWRAIHDEVLRQDQNGTLQLTYTHPDIAQAIDAATTHVSAVRHALDQALGAPPTTPAHTQAVAQAGAHHDAAQTLTKAAGAQVPLPQMVAAAPAVATGLLHAAQAVKQALTQAPPSSTENAHRVMQATSAPQHAADVAKAHGLQFQMDASGHGVQVTSSAAQQPADLQVTMPSGGGAAGPNVDAVQPTRPTVNKWTPLIAIGSVAAALGVGALIQNAAGSHGRRRGRGRRRFGPSGTVIVR